MVPDATTAAADRLRAIAAWAPGYAAALVNLAGEIEEVGGPNGSPEAAHLGAPQLWAAGIAAVILTGGAPDA